MVRGRIARESPSYAAFVPDPAAARAAADSRASSRCFKGRPQR
jgi:hypothetical protein